MKLKFLFSTLLVISFLFSAKLSFADTPTVVSFTSNRTAITSNQPLGFSWAIQNGGEPSITFNCPSGVHLWKSDSLVSVPCNTAQTFGSQGVNATYFSNSIDLIVTNTSGATRTLTATLTPVDNAGVTYPSLIKSVSVPVQTDPEPVVSFTSTSVSSSITMSYEPVTFSWITRGTTGVNFMMFCQNNVIATSSSYSYLGASFPCNQPMFLSDPSSVGSLTFGLLNTSGSNADIRFTILPAMETGLYDASHGKSVLITVKTYVPPDISVISFDGNDRVDSGAPAVFSWNVSGVPAINLKTSCDYPISIALSGTTTPVGGCGNYIFSSPVLAVSSTTLIFNNSSNTVQPVSIFLVPLRNDGAYDLTKSKARTFMVYPKGMSVQNTAVVKPATIPSGVGQGNNAGVSNGVPKYKFTKILSLGSRGIEVTNLQTFLKNYPDLYPEGLVTGYFGPASVRAIKRFQEKYGVAQNGVAGYGLVGPKTRAKLNKLQ